ncbi:hypothetical protein, partial [uncultured Bosea sp.]|uniref:hypothetical protein n=1 Tax=uncultured Bosea sp. TaxID=211457 RepID=UPI0025F49E5A
GSSGAIGFDCQSAWRSHTEIPSDRSSAAGRERALIAVADALRFLWPGNTTTVLAASIGCSRRRQPRCLIPGFADAVISRQWKEALWARFTMGAP